MNKSLALSVFMVGFCANTMTHAATVLSYVGNPTTVDYINNPSSPTSNLSPLSLKATFVTDQDVAAGFTGRVSSFSSWMMSYGNIVGSSSMSNPYGWFSGYIDFSNGEATDWLITDTQSHVKYTQDFVLQTHADNTAAGDYIGYYSTPGAGNMPASNFNNPGVWTVQVQAVPVPAAALLFGSGLIGLGGVARRRRLGSR